MTNAMVSRIIGEITRREVREKEDREQDDAMDNRNNERGPLLQKVRILITII